MIRKNTGSLSPLESLLLATELAPEEVESLPIREVYKGLREMGIRTDDLAIPIKTMVREAIEEEERHEAFEDLNIFIGEFVEPEEILITPLGG